MGNELLEEGGDKLIYRHAFEIPEELIEELHSFLRDSQYSLPWREEPHIETRVGMVNFSICGRGCRPSARKRYAAYDGATGERERIRDILINKFPDLDVAIGGQISLDIFPRGNDKSQSIHYLLQQSHDQIIFIGDRCEEGGNDFAARQTIEKLGCGVHFNVGSWVETRAILNSSALYTSRDGIKS
jgi:phosphomannomutase